MGDTLIGRKVRHKSLSFTGKIVNVLSNPGLAECYAVEVEDGSQVCSEAVNWIVIPEPVGLDERTGHDGGEVVGRVFHGSSHG